MITNVESAPAINLSQLDALGALPNLISDQQQRELTDQGFTILHDLIDTQWLLRLRQRFDEIVDAEGDQAAREHHQETGADRLANLVNKGVEFDRVWSHPETLALIRFTLHDDVRLSSVNGREAKLGGGIQELHGDWKRPRPDFPVVHVANSLWALDDLHPDNGAPRVIPGTHRRRELPSDVLADPLAPHPDEVIVTMPAGSVVVFNAHLWHGGTTNRSGARRRVLHGYYTRRCDPQQQDQRRWITPATRRRLCAAQAWLLDVE